jgi:tRNA threonylcarbamoyladenosine biosynthesis protein TsaB
MKLYLDTSTNVTVLRLDDNEYTWESGRGLADGLLKFIHDKLVENGADWRDLTELAVNPGPGSFTGLRIGISVINTLADQLQIPIVLPDGIKHKIVLPDYGRSANVSTPKK